MSEKTINNDELLDSFDDLTTELFDCIIFMRTDKFCRLNQDDKIIHFSKFKKKVALKNEVRKRILEKMNNTY